jgi:tRNA pseudouridine38-40 synthase
VSSLTRFCLTIQYDGSPFHGWQLQPKARTVQGEVERVLKKLTGARRPVVASGRTDGGVHALGQVASVAVPSHRWSAKELRRALNALLPREIWIKEARQVDPDFHPRFDARKRSYAYRIGTAPESGSPFHHPWCWDLSDELLDSIRLEEAATLIPGQRSFRRFAKAGQPHRGERCHVFTATWIRWGELGLEFRIEADRYLHHMVRYLVGTMVDVGLGRRPLDEMRVLLTNPDSALRTSAPAPARGLFLHQVEYEEGRLGEGLDRDPPGATPPSSDPVTGTT